MKFYKRRYKAMKTSAQTEAKFVDNFVGSGEARLVFKDSYGYHFLELESEADLRELQKQVGVLAHNFQRTK